jgi:hypothetical protein
MHKIVSGVINVAEFGVLSAKLARLTSNKMSEVMSLYNVRDCPTKRMGARGDVSYSLDFPQPYLKSLRMSFQEAYNAQ